MEQRHITAWYRADGTEINGSFERWSYKRPQSVLNKCKELYTRYYGFYASELKEAAYLVIYQSSYGIPEGKEVLRIAKEAIVSE